MKHILLLASVLILGGFMISSSLGYIIGASYTWAPGEPGYNPAATLDPGTINISYWSMMGDFLGRSATQPGAASWGSSGVAVGWDDTWTGGGNSNTNGDARDGLWVQIFSDGGWWDMGRSVRSIAVSSSQDHGPYLGEGLEYRIYASNTLWDPAPVLVGPAGLTTVYLDGWRPHNRAEDANGNGWLSDDITAVFNLGDSYRYIKLEAWAQTGSYNEPEIDAIAAPIPEPSTLILLGIGIAGIAGYGIRRKKKA